MRGPAQPEASFSLSILFAFRIEIGVGERNHVLVIAMLSPLSGGSPALPRFLQLAKVM
jgi:hypothetical protein